VRAILAHGLDGRRDAGTVDQAHQLAHAGGGGHRGLAVGFLADVALDEQAAYLVRHVLAGFYLQVGDHHLAAVSGQHARRAFAQARGAAGDDEDLACDIHVPLPVQASAAKARSVICSTVPVPLMRR
jgi:L-alanine-DL-glutamate epimerase-like enolase superfamily enzyme